MTQKERLVDLLRKSQWPIKDFPEADLNTFVQKMNDWLADYLLENGVIVPPCKAGDVVFAIIEGRVLEGKVDDVWFDDDIGRWEFDVNTGLGFPMFPEERIGTKVFFSREAAEQALKERKDENSV